MAPKRFSVYAGPPIQAALRATKDDEEDGNRSGRLNAVCQRYLMIVDYNLQRLAFSRAEWCAIMDANNGTWFLDDFAAEGIAANIADTPELSAKWEIDGPALARRVQALDLPAKVAIVEAIERFWARSDQDTDAALISSGIHPTSA